MEYPGARCDPWDSWVSLQLRGGSGKPGTACFQPVPEAAFVQKAVDKTATCPRSPAGSEETAGLCTQTTEPGGFPAPRKASADTRADLEPNDLRQIWEELEE